MYKNGGGGIKFLARGASKYTPPPPSREKCLSARNGGMGGGGYIISPWISDVLLMCVFFPSCPREEKTIDLRMQLYVLSIGSFQLTSESFCLQLCLGVLLTAGAFVTYN